MAITKKPTAASTVEDFITGAPDAEAKNSKKDEREIVTISMKIEKKLLAEIDTYAKRKGLTRSGLLKFAASSMIQKD